MAEQLNPFQDIRLECLAPSPTNPRKTFTDLDDLATSIREQGVMQPILVRLWPDDYPTPEGRDDRPAYEIVAGERRYRAARIAGLDARVAPAGRMGSHERGRPHHHMVSAARSCFDRRRTADPRRHPAGDAPGVTMTKTEIIARLRTLSTEMIEIGAAMDYYAGLSDGPMSKHGAELVDAGLIVAEWVEEIGKESP